VDCSSERKTDAVDGELEFLYPFGDGAEVVKQHILILTGKAEKFPLFNNSTRQLAIATNKPKQLAIPKRARLYRAGSPLQSRYQCRGKELHEQRWKLLGHLL